MRHARSPRRRRFIDVPRIVGIEFCDGLSAGGGVRARRTPVKVRLHQAVITRIAVIVRLRGQVFRETARHMPPTMARACPSGHYCTAELRNALSILRLAV